MPVIVWSSDVCSSDLLSSQPRSSRVVTPCPPEKAVFGARKFRRSRRWLISCSSFGRGDRQAGCAAAAFDVMQQAAAPRVDEPGQRRAGDIEIGRAHSELQSLMRISYAVFCLKKKTQIHTLHEKNYTQ